MQCICYRYCTIVFYSAVKFVLIYELKRAFTIAFACVNVIVNVTITPVLAYITTAHVGAERNVNRYNSIMHR